MKTLLEKTVTGSTQNQQRIVGRGYCFGRIGPVSDQQRVVDQFLLIWSRKKSLSKFFGKNIFLMRGFFYWQSFSFGLPGFVWHPNPTRLGLQG